MWVLEEVRQSVVFLGYQKPDGTYRFAGTGFFLTRLIGQTGPQFIATHGPGFIVQPP